MSQEERGTMPPIPGPKLARCELMRALKLTATSLVFFVHFIQMKDWPSYLQRTLTYGGLVAILVNLKNVVVEGDMETLEYGVLSIFIIQNILNFLIAIYYTRIQAPKLFFAHGLSALVTLNVVSFLTFMKYYGYGHCEKKRECINERDKVDLPPEPVIKALVFVVAIQVSIYYSMFCC